MTVRRLMIPGFELPRNRLFLFVFALFGTSAPVKRILCLDCITGVIHTLSAGRGCMVS